MPFAFPPVRFWVCWVAMLASAAGVHGAEGVSLSFSRDVAPILVRRCVACHGLKNPRGDYQLHTFSHLSRPGASGEPAVAARKPQASQMFRLLSAEGEERMPQEGDPLSEAEISTIGTWITQGAEFDGPDPAAMLSSYAPKPARPGPPERYARPVPITALAFSPAGEALAASGYREVTFWNPADGALVRRLGGIAERVQGLAYSPDGQTLAVAAGIPGRLGEVMLVDPRSDAPSRELATVEDEVFGVAFHPDGRRLAACGADRSVRIFDLEGVAEPRLIQAHADWVMGLAWSPDGTRLATAGRDKAAKVIDVATGDVVTTHAGHEEQVFAVAFTAEGSAVLSGGRGKALQRWKAEGDEASKKDVRKKEAGNVPFHSTGDIHRVIALGSRAFVADGSGSVTEIDLDKGSIKLRYTGGSSPCTALALDGAGERLAAGDLSGTIRIWKVAEPSPAVTFVAAPGIGSPGAGLPEVASPGVGSAGAQAGSDK